VGLSLIGATYIVLFISAAVLGSKMGLSLPIALLLALVVAVAGWPANKGIAYLWMKYCMRMAMKCYRSIWQMELYQFLSRSRMSLSEFAHTLAVVPEDVSEFTPLIQICVMSDDGINVYSHSQQFLS